MYPYSYEFTNQQKWDYIKKNCSGVYSSYGMEKIDNDPNLTPSQKEEMKSFLKIYG